MQTIDPGLDVLINPTSERTKFSMINPHVDSLVFAS